MRTYLYYSIFNFNYKNNILVIKSYLHTHNVNIKTFYNEK